MGAGSVKMIGFAVDGIHGSADYLAPGAIEINRYQQEIYDKVRRRFYFGQRIQQVLATGYPSRYFEQQTIPVAAFTKPRILAATASQPKRVERFLILKAIMSQINYGIFDSEIVSQQGQFEGLQAKDLEDAVTGVLKLHDTNLWNGNDTDLLVATTDQYYGVSGQIVAAPTVGSYASTKTIASNASLVDGIKTRVAEMVSRQDYEVRPTSLYMNPLTADLFDQEAKTLQLYYNEVEILPGVIVKAIPTQAGNIPIIADAGITLLTGSGGSTTQHAMFLLTEEDIEYHYLTSPVPRVFQLGLLGNLAAQFVIVKFGGVVVKGASYSHRILFTER